MELFSIRIQRTFQLVSTDLASAWIVMALRIIGSVNETPVNQIHYHILPHFTFL